MEDKVNKIIIDTNLWISFLITKNYKQLDEIIFSKQAILIFSQELLDEFLEVVKRPKFRRYFASNDIEDILYTIDECAEFIDVKTKVEVCKDPKDDFLLSLSMDGKADYLLTGDKELLEIKKYRSTVITTISEFLEQNQTLVRQ